MRSRDDDGFILVAALWMLAALAALTSVYAVYAMQTAPSAALPEERLQAEAALRAGVELCAYRQLSWPKSVRPDFGAFSAQVGAARIDVVYRSESARIDLNESPHDAIAGLFHELGAPTAAAASLADRVVAWRSKLAQDARQQEATIYAKAGLAYGPPGAPFDSPLELALLPGMTRDLANRAGPYVTVFGADMIDPLVADPVVLAALPGATPSLVGALARRAQRAASRRRDALPDRRSAQGIRRACAQQSRARRDSRHVERPARARRSRSGNRRRSDEALRYPVLARRFRRRLKALAPRLLSRCNQTCSATMASG